jgi:hypothetical protein
MKNNPVLTSLPWVLVAGLLAVAAIQASGEPTTFAELNAWYPEVAAAQNAATLYAEAFAMLPDNSSDALPPVGQSQKTLDLLHRAANFPQCRYLVDFKLGFQAKLPHLAKVKLSAELLQQEAILNATKGRMDLVTESVQAGLGLVRSLEREPATISQLVRSRAIELTVTGLEQALWHKAFLDEQLSQLQTAFQIAEINDATAYKRALVGERCMGLAAFQSPLDFFKTVGGDGQGIGNFVGPEFEKKVADYVKGGTNKLDREFYLKQMGDIIAMADAPFPEQLDKAGIWNVRIITNADEKGFLISPSLLPSLAKVPEKSAIGLAELRVAQSVLAVERYRLAHNNSLPNSLADLVPQYLPAVPLDPFDGKPLRFKTIPKRGYLVYSIGKDRDDDGGIHKPLKPTVGARYDLAMSVLRK